MHIPQINREMPLSQLSEAQRHDLWVQTVLHIPNLLLERKSENMTRKNMSNGFENMPHQDGFEIWMDLDPHFSRLFWLRLVWNLSRQPGTSPQHRSRRCWGSPSRDFARFLGRAGRLGRKVFWMPQVLDIEFIIIHHSMNHAGTKEGMNERANERLTETSCLFSEPIVLAAESCWII